MYEQPTLFTVESSTAQTEQETKTHFDMAPENDSRVPIRARALQLFERGWGYKGVASELGIPAYTVRDWARQYRKGEFKVIPTRRRYSEAVRQEVKRLHDEGFLTGQIAAALNMPKRSVRSLLVRVNSQKEEG